jgi:tetratricopeptide (TPR) repeat protein
MPEPSWSRIRAVFEAAVELPVEEQTELLQRTCGADGELRAAVERLLRLDRRGTAALDLGAPRTLLGRSALQVGRRFGAYRLLAVLGQGGMGTVFLAEQERPSRRVALKVLRCGLPDPRVRQRLLYEAEVLARLQHPHIAQVYAAGIGVDQASGEEVPYFAMELVDGAVTLDQWLAARQPTVAERLTLFLQACDAVQHGHQRAVLHRDLKPANVLIGADGRVKVIDFGIARATDAEAVRQTLATRAGELLGTLAYMSPEQLAGDPARIDARADVYALGVMLYELLSGRLPFDPAGQTLVTFAAQVANGEPPPLSRLVPIDRELDWIAARALRRERDERYASVAELAGDVRAHLAHQPVRARAPSTAYLLRKFVRRHRLPVAAAVAVLAALIAGLSAASLGWMAAREALVQAQAEAETRGAVTRFLTDMVEAARAERDGSEVRVLDLLGQAEKAVVALAQRRPDIALSLRNTMANTYQTLGLLDQALGHLQAILPEARARLGPRHAVTLDVQHSLGVAWSQAGRLPEAEAMLRSVLAERLELLSPAGDEVATTRAALATVLQSRGDGQAAAPLLAAARATFTALHGGDGRKTLHVRGAQVRLELEQGRAAVAADLAAALVADAERAMGPDDPLTLQVRTVHAQALLAAGQAGAAETILNETLALRQARFGARHRSVLDTLNDLAAVLERQGRLEAAEACAREVVAIESGTIGNAVQALVARNNLAVLLERQDELAEARQLFETLLRDAASAIPDGHWLHGVFRKGYAICLRKLGDLAAAEAQLCIALGLLEKNLPAGDPRLRKAWEAAAQHYEAAGKPELARDYRQRIGGP